MNVDKQFVRERFYRLYHEKWKGTQAEFAQAVKAIDPGNGISNDYVSKLLKGKYTPSERNLQLFCTVLGVDYKSEFMPSSYEDKYRCSGEYQDKAAAYLSQVATDSFGLNLSLLYGLRQLIDFDTEFPLFSELIVAAADPEQFFPSGLTYKRAEPAEAYDASYDKRLFQVSTGGKAYNISPEDMKFLKVVQNTIIRKVSEMFSKHRQELIDAANLAAEKCEGYTFAEMVKSGRDPLSPEELQKIDKWGIYTVDELNRYNIPLPPDDLQLTAAHIDPGIVIGRKKK